MEIKAIKSSADHEEALSEIEKLMMRDDLVEEDEDRLDVLSTLVHAYEEKNFPQSQVDAADIILFALEQGRFTRAELDDVLGGALQASKILSGEGMLTLPMIWDLDEKFGVAAELLVKKPSKIVVGTKEG